MYAYFMRSSKLLSLTIGIWCCNSTHRWKADPRLLSLSNTSRERSSRGNSTSYGACSRHLDTRYSRTNHSNIQRYAFIQGSTKLSQCANYIDFCTYLNNILIHIKHNKLRYFLNESFSKRRERHSFTLKL